VAVYRPPGASPEKKAGARWVRWGDECESPLPPADWPRPDFDDYGWPRRHGPVFGGYGGDVHRADLALLCLRARFGVADPAAVKDLKLQLTYRGGAVVYLNGREVARGHLPAGQMAPTTPAQEYPPEVYDLPKGDRIPPNLLPRFEARLRKLECLLDPSLLRQGLNLLAVELHGAGDGAGKFKPADWNTTGLAGIRLTAPPGSPVTCNSRPPAGVRVWNADPMLQPGVDVEHGDPLEPLAPVRLQAPVNGFASGQIVLSSPEAFKGVSAKAGDLKGPDGSVIPAAALRVRYAKVSGGFVALLDAPDPDPASQRPPELRGKRPAPRPEAGQRYLPIWVTAKVPAGARSGTYRGELEISGIEPPVKAPVEVTVFGWNLADPRGWKTWVNLLQSPESVAGFYKVPLWSEEHFQLLEKSFALMGECGNDILGVSAVARTVFGNDPLILFRKAGEKHEPEFKYLERYLALYDKHAGPPKFLSLQVWHYGMYYRGAGRDGGKQERTADTIPVMMLVDGKPVNDQLPMHGKPGTEELWGQVMEGLRARMKKLGWNETRLLLGTSGDNWVGPRTAEFFRKIAPEAHWRALTHGGGCPKWGVTDEERTQPNGMIVGYLEMARRIAFVRDPVPGHPRTTNARDCLGGTAPFGFRSLTPANCVNARYEGFSWKGLDYWAYALPDGTIRSALNRDVGFGNMVGSTPRAIAAPGPKGAVTTQQFEMLREGVQDTEAAWLLRKAVGHPELRAALGKELAERAEAIVAEVGDVYEIGLRAGPHGGSDIRDLVYRLYKAAEDADGVLSSPIGHHPPEP
jgi:hypothetical protein